MSSIVLDASVLVAMIKAERLDRIPDLPTSSISTVNIAEVLSTLSRLGEPTRKAGLELLALVGEHVAFTDDHARVCADLLEEPGMKGLSLGDRACLALALTTGSEVYTTDRVWSRLRLPCRIHQLRDEKQSVQ